VTVVAGLEFEMFPQHIIGKCKQMCLVKNINLVLSECYLILGGS